MEFIMAVLDSTALDARNPRKKSFHQIFEEKIKQKLVFKRSKTVCFFLLFLVIIVIKEWSILAIRNLCENNMENQQIIRQLTKVGDSNSDTIKEFNLDLGSLRINPTE